MKYTNLQNKYIIKIPENITILYCEKKKIITFIGPLKKKIIKIKNKTLFYR